MCFRFDSNYFVNVVKLNDRRTVYTIKIKIRLCTFHIPEFKLLPNFEVSFSIDVNGGYA